jgi:anti-anti-sigma factor
MPIAELPVSLSPHTLSLRPLQTVTTRTTPSIVRVAVSGEVDLATAPQLRQVCLAALAQQRPSALCLDLAGVSFLDCAGVSALVGVRIAAREAGCLMWVDNPQPQVGRVLHLTGQAQALARSATGPVPTAAWPS